jgi:hypothetical protein
MKRLLGIIMFILISLIAFAGEWDYVPAIELRYLSNETDQRYHELIAAVGSPSSLHQISKLPREVSQSISNGLRSYQLDVGDCFLFSCGYEWTRPKMIVVILRITSVNSDGTCHYIFYAWQMI